MWCHLITVNIFLLIFVNRSNLILPVRQAAYEGSKKFLAPRICKNHSSLASHKCDRCVEEKWAVSTYFYFDISSKRLLNWMLFIDSSCYNSKTQTKRTSKINVYYRSNRYQKVLGDQKPESYIHIFVFYISLKKATEMNAFHRLFVLYQQKP